MSNIKSYPTQGFDYRVVSGDRIKTIAYRAYGSEKYAFKIVEGNKALLSGRKISPEGLPFIYDDILNIPRLKPAAKTELVGKDPDSFILVLDGREINITEGRLLQTMNTGADGWTAVIPWTPGGDKELDKKLLPYQYPETSIFIGGKLRNTGRLYTVSPSLTGAGQVKSLAGFTSTVDLLDSTVSPPYERNNSTLEQITADLLAGTDIDAEFKGDTGGPFDRVTAGKEEKKFSHLAKLASQRGLIVGSSTTGALTFIRANTTGKPVGTLQEGRPPVQSWGATYDGRKLFNSYKATGESPGGDAQTGVATDANIPGSRSITFSANETTPGNIQAAAEWQRSRRYADALRLTLSVVGFYAPSGNLWEPNTLVSVVAPSLDLPGGFTFLIEQVEFQFSANGLTTTLKLVPPQVYTREPVPYVWGTV